MLTTEDCKTWDHSIELIDCRYLFTHLFVCSNTLGASKGTKKLSDMPSTNNNDFVEYVTMPD